MNYDIWVAHGRQRINSVLTYSSHKKLMPGEVVKVPIRSAQTLGVVVGKSTKKIKKTKDITETSGHAIPQPYVQLMRWIQAYYPAPVSSIASLFLPSVKMLDHEPAQFKPSKNSPLSELTQDQKKAVNTVYEVNSPHIYLHGVTASGKTRIYLELMKKALETGRSVVVLTPEIGLTTPLASIIEKHLGGAFQVINYHSQLTQKQRDIQWATAMDPSGPKIVIGPRSALFLPITDVGLILVDEAHDAAYKQEQLPFYSAVRVAAKLGSLNNAKVIYGSATPDLVDYFAFKNKSLPIVHLNKRALSNSYTRKDTIIDLTDKSNMVRSKMMAEQLVKAMEEAIKNKKQTILFLNRRGSARTILCQDCNWRLTCPHCDTGLTYHADTNTAICHGCAFSQKTPVKCKECSSFDIMYQTPGTKALEQEVNRLFPEAVVARFDKDSSQGSRLHQKHDEIASGDIDVLIGTQMLVKGLDVPNLEVVGVIQADVSLSLPDFSSSEKTYQLISQVAGRLNRGHGDGKLFLQTYNPNNKLIAWALSQDFESFYEHEVTQRLKHGFPPAYYMLQIIAKRKTQNGAKSALSKLHTQLQQHNEIVTTTPSPCFIEKKAGNYCWQIVVKSKDRQKLVKIMKDLPSTLSANIDVTNLL